MARAVQGAVRTDDWYTKKDAAAMSVIAVVLMMVHHFFGFRSYLAEGVEWHSLLTVGGIEIERIVAAFGKICVSVFAFNSGYVLWKMKSRYRSVGSLLRRSLAFLLSYWLVLALFWFYAAIAGEPIPTGRALVANVIGLATGPGMPYVNVSFAWYVAYYVVFLALSPLLLLLFSGNLLTDLVVYMVVALAVKWSDFPFMYPLIIGIEGALFAKYGVFARVGQMLPVVRIRYALPAIGLLVILRQGVILLDNQGVIELGGGRLLGCPGFHFSQCQHDA